MTLHPQARAMVEAFAAGPALDYANLTAADFRAAFAVPQPRPLPPDGVAVSDRVIAGPAGPLRVRLYRPPGQGPLPIVLFAHGGGFVIGAPEMTDGVCRALAAGAGALIVSPDYRLAPEHPFPAGLDDAWAALRWARAAAGDLDADPARLAVAGDSSGGAFAAALAQMACDQGLPLRAQLLLYPALDPAGDTESYRAFATGCFLTAGMMAWYWRQYLPDGLPDDPRAAPARRADLAGLAPAHVVTAECDVLRDEAEAYADRLAAAGVPVTRRRWAGQVHGFLLQQGVIDDADAALVEAAAALARRLA